MIVECGFLSSLAPRTPKLQIRSNIFSVKACLLSGSIYGVMLFVLADSMLSRQIVTLSLGWLVSVIDTKTDGFDCDRSTP